MRLCPICGSNKINVLYQTKLADVNNRLPDWVEVVACDKCGFCYSNTTASLQDYDEYYTNCNIHGGGVIRSQKPEAVMRDKILFKIHSQFCQTMDEVIDIGCGSGEWLNFLYNNGYQHLTGVDVIERNVDYLENGIKRYCGSVYDTPRDIHKYKFDVVYSLAVLEHLLVPINAVKNMALYLREKGKMIVAVPDMEQISRSDTPCSHHFHQEHINYFSVYSLDALMRNAGMKRIYNMKMQFGTDAEDLLCAVYERDSRAHIMPVIRDEVTASSIRQYLGHAETIENKTYEQVEDIIKQNKSVVIWGCGARAMSVLSSTRLSQADVIKCVDSSNVRIGKSIHINENIYQIEPVQNCKTINKDIVICICVNVKIYQEEILQNILEMGLNNEIAIL